MPRITRTLLWVTPALVVVLGLLAASPHRALAHNTLESTDPSDGAILAIAPTQITFDFSSSVPLETATVQVIQADGTRTEAVLSHAPAGEDRLVAALPPLQPGDTTIRWRLVGPDGHPLTGRVGLTITAPVTAPAPAPTTSALPTAPTTMPPAVAAPPPAPPADLGADGGLSVPSALRWILRYGSYLAVMTVIGVLLTDRYVWSGASRRPVLQRAMRWALVAVVGLAAAQLLVVASDIAGRAPWAALGSLDAALRTGAGLALGVRMLLAGGLWLLLFHTTTVDAAVRRSALALGGLAMLGTWAWAGHSATQRWPELGFPLDVAHHAAAALWIAALLVVGVIATKRLAADELTPVVIRLSRAAEISVALIVLTGVVQSLRLVGNPARLLDATHGTYLAIKLLAVIAMLALASVNRRRILAGLGHTKDIGPDTTIGQLRRSILAELAVGLVVIGITSAMVVSPPATADRAARGRGDDTAAIADNYNL